MSTPAPNIRSQIPYGSESFQQLYRERTAVERVFSRLLTIAMQDLPTRGLDSAPNLCTIAHITVLLVALAAHRTGCPINWPLFEASSPTSST